MNIDLNGPDGGLIAKSFAAGCVAAFTFLSLIGKFIWSKIGAAKDDNIARLEKQLEKQERDADEDRQRCANMETRLVSRIQNLEGLFIRTASGDFRQEIQRAISELRGEQDHMRHMNERDGG